MPVRREGVTAMRFAAMAQTEKDNTLSIGLRPAVPEDAADLVDLVNAAGEGLPAIFWRSMAPEGIDPFLVGRQRICRDEGVFSYTKAEVAVVGNGVAGTIIDYALPDLPEAVSLETPPLIRPLNELENLACGSWYVNILAVAPAWRRRGIGQHLLRAAEYRALRDGRRELAIIVSDGNLPAQRLYAAMGFVERARRRMFKGAWQNPGQHWRLLTRPVPRN
jgi:GNAT superfamily N-acetyltransferase